MADLGLSIHIGAHKTASTYLEQSIWTVEERLMEHDYMFLSPTMLRSKPLELERALYDLGGDAKRNRELRKLLREILAGNEHVLISEERILGAIGSAQFLGDDGRIYLDADRRLLLLLQMLNTTQATIYMSVRSPASFLTSVYGGHFAFGHLPENGELLTPGRFFAGYDPVSLRWSELVQRLLDTNVARIVCWRFEDLAQVKDKLLRHMLNQELAGQVTDIPLIRPGLTQSAYEKIVAGSDGLSPQERVEFARRAMKEHPKGPDEPPLQIFGDTVFRQCDENYAQDCQKIAAMPRLEFLWPE